MVVSVVYEKGKTTAGFASKVTGEIDSRLVASSLSKCEVARTGCENVRILNSDDTQTKTASA